MKNILVLIVVLAAITFGPFLCNGQHSGDTLDPSQVEKIRLANQHFFEQLENGFTNASGDWVQGYPDAHRIAASKEFSEWLGKQSAGVMTLASSLDPRDGVILLAAYKESHLKIANHTAGPSVSVAGVPATAAGTGKAQQFNLQNIQASIVTKTRPEPTPVKQENPKFIETARKYGSADPGNMSAAMQKRYFADQDAARIQRAKILKAQMAGIEEAQYQAWAAAHPEEARMREMVKKIVAANSPALYSDNAGGMDTRMPDSRMQHELDALKMDIEITRHTAEKAQRAASDADDATRKLRQQNFR